MLKETAFEDDSMLSEPFEPNSDPRSWPRLSFENVEQQWGSPGEDDHDVFMLIMFIMMTSRGATQVRTLPSQLRASKQFYYPKESFTQAGDLFGCIDGAEMKESVMQWFAPSTSAQHQAPAQSIKPIANHQAPVQSPAGGEILMHSPPTMCVCCKE